jgi:hypothetical protein
MSLHQPTKREVTVARERVKLTLQQAAKLVHLSGHARWSEYESGKRNIEISRWELFLLKTGQHPDACTVNGMVVIPLHRPLPG